jgi:hypothetical protein
MKDFDVFIAKDGEIYRYLINNANFVSFIKGLRSMPKPVKQILMPVQDSRSIVQMVLR